MKKILFLFITGLTFSASYSQEQISDAIRYSQDNLTGTARFRAMSGAFGAVGGDLSSISVNPAGSAIFSNNQVGVSFSNQNIKNDSDYFGTKTSEKTNSFTLNQAGGVFVFHDRNPNNNWKKIAIAATYETTNNFKNDVFSAGTNPTKSVADYFLSYANGVPLDVLDNVPYGDLFYDEQQAHFGYQGYIINPDSNDPENTSYSTNVPEGSNDHINEVYTTGYNSKLSFNIATSYKDRIYFGANLNAHITDYRKSSYFRESNENQNPLETNATISNLNFNTDQYTYGNGFSFQLGVLAKVTESFRLGLAYESNTWYELYTEISQNLRTTIQADGEQPITTTENPQLINVYEPYTLQTPGKVTFSGAYVFGKSGLISIDYAIKDYSNSKFKPSNQDSFRKLNNEISNELTSNGELRIGGEYKIKQLSLRGGYRFEGSPYKNGTTIGDLTSYSGGLGYNFGSTKLDLAYSYAERKSNQGFFSQGFTNGANIKSKLNTVSLTLLFEL
ncbi:transporter [Flavobacterium sp. GA093]|uniref:Transporter n=1 Tax=Flavobacterium hydrocarbonoxydans TaxID=2683249 RepID=A0A6I4NU34_9FLAO|nr:outer membrane protein transport protein [Flavobacterium hydrocarbonoxydans]MWB95995.1 transporter [Flavobacterium hydrocarbonoxydans]